MRQLTTLKKWKWHATSLPVANKGQSKELLTEGVVDSIVDVESLMPCNLQEQQIPVHSPIQHNVQHSNLSTPINVPSDEINAVDAGVGDIGQKIAHPHIMQETVEDVEGILVGDTEDVVVVVEVDLDLEIRL